MNFNDSKLDENNFLLENIYIRFQKYDLGGKVFMKVIFCPYCHQRVTEDAAPTVVTSAIGFEYVCYKKICKNIEKHYNHCNVIIPYKPENK